MDSDTNRSAVDTSYRGVVCNTYHPSMVDFWSAPWGPDIFGNVTDNIPPDKVGAPSMNDETKKVATSLVGLCMDTMEQLLAYSQALSDLCAEIRDTYKGLCQEIPDDLKTSDIEKLMNG